MIKTKWNRKRTTSKNPTHSLERQTLCFSSYKNCKLNIKLWWVGARERKKKEFFVPFIFCEGNFFNICVLSQYMVCWIYFHNIHTFFTYQKTTSYTFLLVCKIVESLQCIQNKIWILSLKTQLVDLVFCAVYRASKLLW